MVRVCMSVKLVWWVWGCRHGVTGAMEFEGWNEMVETFVRVSVAMHGHTNARGMSLMSIWKTNTWCRKRNGDR